MYYLGIDSGGTKTRVVVADRTGLVLSMTQTDGFDPFAGSDWETRLETSLRNALEFGTISAAVIGLPCHGEDEQISEAQRRVVSRVLEEIPYLVLNDVEVAFDGAFAGNCGALLLAGTGSMVWANSGHRTVRVGGWGDQIGDEGSAYWMGREALTLTTQILDGRSSIPGDFAQAMLVAAGCDEASLIGWVSNSARRKRIASLAPAVCDLASKGNVAASDLIQRAAHALSRQVCTAREKLDAPHLDWAATGGAFRCRILQKAVVQILGEPVPTHLDPAAGAVLRALGLVGAPTGPNVVKKLSEITNHTINKELRK